MQRGGKHRALHENRQETCTHSPLLQHTLERVILMFWDFEPEHIFGECREASGTFSFLFPNGGVKVLGGFSLLGEYSFTLVSDLWKMFTWLYEEFLLVLFLTEISNYLDLLVLSLILCWFSPLGKQTLAGVGKITVKWIFFYWLFVSMEWKQLMRVFLFLFFWMLEWDENAMAFLCDLIITFVIIGYILCYNSHALWKIDYSLI